jgi:hypothetical protein
MLARAVAGEAGVPFLFASGSQFDEMFVVSICIFLSLHTRVSADLSRVLEVS